MTMRIVDVCEFYSPRGGGVRSYIDRKMTLMAEAGHELIVLAPSTEDRIEQRPGGGRIIWIKAPAMPFDRNYRMFWDAEPVHAWLDRLRPDVVEASSPWRPAWIVGSWRGEATRIFFLHNDPVVSYPYRWFGPVAPRERIDRMFEWFNRYLRRIAPQYDSVVVCGESLRRRLANRGVGPVVCVPLGIDRAAFSPTLRDPELRAKLLAECDLPESATLLIGIGRHHPEKRWPLVIDAVQAAGTHAPIGFMLIGNGMDRPAVERQVRGSPHIRLFQPVYDRPHLARILASADALIHGCEGETFGLVASEALASGLPLIVPDEGGCSDIARPDFAELWRANEARAASEAILRMVSRDQIVVRAAAAQAALSVRSDRQHVAALLAHYEELRSGSAQRAA
jgi:alpha-1,6-mannosyltransferase